MTPSYVTHDSSTRHFIEITSPWPFQAKSDSRVLFFSAVSFCEAIKLRRFIHCFIAHVSRRLRTFSLSRVGAVPVSVPGLSVPGTFTTLSPADRVLFLLWPQSDYGGITTLSVPNLFVRFCGWDRTNIFPIFSLCGARSFMMSAKYSQISAVSGRTRAHCRGCGACWSPNSLEV